jgi:flavin reductase (DIM6/NTAB) family NADH-FMN oxidoreductase RutF
MQTLDISRDSAAALRSLYSCFPSGVTALCALRDGVATGLAVSSFTSVSLEPALVSVSLQSTSATWAALESADTFGLSVLSETQDAICRQLSRKGADRFSGVNWHAYPSGAIFIEGAVAWLECSLHHRFTAGDHEIAIFSVKAAKANPDLAPLVFHRSRFRKLVPEDMSAA